MKLKIGNDVGNSDQKIYINNDYIKQPSCFSKVSQMPNLIDVSPDAVLKDLFDNLLVTINSPAVESGTYYVGKKSLNSGLAIHNMDVTDRKNVSDVYYINTLAIIGAYAICDTLLKKKELPDEAIKVNVDMSCSIPVNQYSKEDCFIVTEKFKGKHNVTVHLGIKRVDTVINFDYIKVLPESVSIMFALRETEDAIDNKKVLHVSIGEGTTEYPVTEGIDFDPNFIKGSNNGIGHAIEKAIDPFKNKLGLRTYSRQLYSEVLQTNNHKFNPLANEFLQDFLPSESEDIIRYVKREIQKANGSIDVVIVHGGGSILLRKYLEDKLLKVCTPLNIKVFFVNENNAVNLEAKGLYTFVKTDLFNALKEKAEKVERLG
jgi:plasmid segregation protein ParM